MLAPILFSAIAFIAILLLCMTGYLLWQNNQSKKEQSKRLEHAVNIESQSYAPNNNEDTKAYDEDVQLRKDYTISSIPWLNKLLGKFLKEHSKKLMILIEQTGLRIKVGEFVLFVGLVSFIGELLVNILLHIPFIGFVGGMVPFLLLSVLKEQRTAKFVQQLPQALDLLSSDLRAGLDVQAAIKHMSEEFPAPLGEEFGKVVAEINLGLTINDALNNLATRVNTMDVQILCTGIIINRELGGNLSELVSSIGNTVRERFRLKGMVKALTAENQGSALLLLILPIALYFILNMLAPETYNSFASDPIGRIILFGCGISMTFGYLVIQKITKLEV